MRNKGINALYLQKGIAIHIVLILSSVAAGIAWGYLNNFLQDPVQLMGTCIIIFFDMEIVRFILLWFNKLNKKYKQRFIETSTVKRIVWMNLIGLLFFYVLFIATNTIGVILWIIGLHLVKGWGFPDFMKIFVEGQVILQVIKATAIALFFSIPIFLFQKWVEAMKKEFKLKEQNLIFQNETLKNQVNPHFLFNSLNTLSSLVNTEVAVAGQFIAKLSLIYRYILDNSSKLNVPLNEEIDFIRDYFYLHQIRNEGKIFLEIDIRDEGFSDKIIPISLQLLIENAIKHNMATQDKPLIINVYLEGKTIVVKNNIQKMATQVVSTKIGLKNLNERVRLHTGKEIIVAESEGYFFVKVPLIV
ncbi:MAG TPA: histidine kinase [Prolixibacteraceae bacterium]|nr:histidine kinase [Prolixibacteraceae bacterium]